MKNIELLKHKLLDMFDWNTSSENDKKLYDYIVNDNDEKRIQKAYLYFRKLKTLRGRDYQKYLKISIL